MASIRAALAKGLADLGRACFAWATRLDPPAPTRGGSDFEEYCLDFLASMAGTIPTLEAALASAMAAARAARIPAAAPGEDAAPDPAPPAWGPRLLDGAPGRLLLGAPPALRLLGTGEAVAGAGAPEGSWTRPWGDAYWDEPGLPDFCADTLGHYAYEAGPDADPDAYAVPGAGSSRLGTTLHAWGRTYRVPWEVTDDYREEWYIGGLDYGYALADAPGHGATSSAEEDRVRRRLDTAARPCDAFRSPHRALDLAYARQCFTDEARRMAAAEPDPAAGDRLLALARAMPAWVAGGRFVLYMETGEDYPGCDPFFYTWKHTFVPDGTPAGAGPR